MYYGKNVEKSCSLCEHATSIPSRGEILCKKKGTVPADGCCRRFKYDPLKRPVFPKPELPQYDSEDFKL